MDAPKEYRRLTTRLAQSDFIRARDPIYGLSAAQSLVEPTDPLERWPPYQHRPCKSAWLFRT